MTETKLDNGTQTKAEAVVADALARHGHAAPDPDRHLRPQLATAPRAGRVEWPRAAQSVRMPGRR